MRSVHSVRALSTEKTKGWVFLMKSRILRGLIMLVLPAVSIAVALATANAAPLHRLASDFQNNTTVGGSGEISTTSAPPGLLVYSKTLSIPLGIGLHHLFSARRLTQRIGATDEGISHRFLGERDGLRTTSRSEWGRRRTHCLPTL